MKLFLIFGTSLALMTTAALAVEQGFDEGRRLRRKKKSKSIKCEDDVSDEIVPPEKTRGKCRVEIDTQEPGYTEDWCYDMPDPDVVWGDPRWPACYPLGVPVWHPHDNIIVTLPDPNRCDVAVSDSWVIAGWHWTYVQLAPGETWEPPRLSWAVEGLLKLMRGSVFDVGENGIMHEDGHWETHVVTPPLMTRSLKVPHNTRVITAGDEGAVFAWMMAPTELLKTPVTDMDAYPANEISGPKSRLLKWKTFKELTGDNFFTDEFWNLPGILVREYDGSRLNYNQWWTVREDNPIDGGYHNHAGTPPNVTFAELHMTMYAATASAGMQSQLPGTQNLNLVENPDPIPEGQGPYWGQNANPETQLVLPMPPGYVHGPIWSVDVSTGEPDTCPNGGVKYPWHRLVLGTCPEGICSGDNVANPYHDPLRYQLWVAFEHPPQYATTPKEMLAFWYNAYLQNTEGIC